MAIPVIKLNLVPPPTTWRRYHEHIGWGLLVAGILSISAVTFFTVKAYIRANQAGRQAVALTNKAREASLQENRVLEELRNIDVSKEQPRWRLAEKVLLERSIPWSRITAEMERSLVQDVRVKSIQRIRSATGQGVKIRLKGEARSRESEVDFVQTLQENQFFQPAEFEREAERQGGGIEFELTLPVNPMPPTYVPLPKYGKVKKTVPAPVMPQQAVAKPKTPAKPKAARKEAKP
jgi:Tfp pilus assembly protein PilN